MHWTAGRGIPAALLGEFLALHFFCVLDRMIRGKKGRTLTDAQNKLLGRFRNQLALWATTPAGCCSSSRG
jgi:hypothetical protein